MTTRPANRRAGWLMLATAPLTAVVSIAAVVGATARAGVEGPVGGGPPNVPDDHGPTATRVAIPALVPGDGFEWCIESLGRAPEGPGAGRDEQMTWLSVAADGPLVEHLRFTVSSGGAGATCASPGPATTIFDGPLAAFGHDTVAGTTGGRAAAATSSPAPYRFEVVLDAAAPNRAQGATASVEVVWEVGPAGAAG